MPGILDERMTQFLIDLAILDHVRLQYSTDKEGTLARLVSEGMSETAAEAIRNRQRSPIRFMIVNNQSSVGLVVKAALKEKGGVKRMLTAFNATTTKPDSTPKGGVKKGAAKKGGKKKNAGKPRK